MRVEILGPSGVGKSTILNRIQPSWDRDVVFPDAFAHMLSALQYNDVLKAVNHFFSKTAPADEYMAHALGAIAKTNMAFDQKFSAIGFIQNSMFLYGAISVLSDADKAVVHDELLLHRGFSFLHLCDDFEAEATAYYQKVPVPDVAVILKANLPTILDRIKQRGSTPNCYRGQQREQLKFSVLKALSICTIAARELSNRGVDVRVVDVSNEIEGSCEQLNAIFTEIFPRVANTESDLDYVTSLKARSIESCKSFRKKAGRYYPRTQDVIYCAFTTPNFTVHRNESQRDAAMRLERFGINKETLQGKRVLDLGSNIGAMLFQATNFSISEGLGIEFDSDKVKIAQEIAALSCLENLSFRQGDIDTLRYEDIGTFDVTFALAVEAHVQNPQQLYTLLGAVTKETLYFEGNSGCDIESVKASLHNVGFENVEYIGFCNDDILPSNNIRPMLKATKKKEE